MDRLLRKFAYFLVIPFVFVFLFEFLVRQIPNDYKEKNKIISSFPLGTEVLILGNSHARDGINPDLLDKEGINLSNSAQSLDFDLQILKKIDEQKHNLEYIILPISFFSLYYAIEDSESRYLLKNYYLYYDMEVPGITYKSEILSGLDPKIQLQRIVEYYLLGREPYISENGYYGSTEIINPDKATMLSNKTYWRQFDYIKNGRDNYKENLSHINRIIEITKNKGIKLYLITPPFLSQFNNVVDDQLHRNISDFGDSIARVHENIFYLNFNEQNDFENRMFKDVSHLNTAGANKLTSKLNLLIK